MRITKLLIALLLILSLHIQTNAVSYKDCSNKNDSTYLKKLFKKGEEAYNKNDFTIAKIKLIEFISANVPVNDTIERYSPGFKYTEMKSIACSFLKVIYFDEGDFENALYYHNLSNGIYKVTYPGCGLGLFEEAANKAFFKSRCFEGIQNYDSAMSSLLNHMDYYMDYFVKLAVVKVGIDSLQKELLNALDKIALYGDIFVLPLLGNDINIGHYNYKTRVINEYIYKSSNGDTARTQSREDIPLTDNERDAEIVKRKENFKRSLLYKLITEHKKDE